MSNENETIPVIPLPGEEQGDDIPTLPIEELEEPPESPHTEEESTPEVPLTDIPDQYAETTEKDDTPQDDGGEYFATSEELAESEAADTSITEALMGEPDENGFCGLPDDQVQMPETGEAWRHKGFFDRFKKSEYMEVSDRDFREHGKHARGKDDDDVELSEDEASSDDSQEFLNNFAGDAAENNDQLPWTTDEDNPGDSLDEVLGDTPDETEENGGGVDEQDLDEDTEPAWLSENDSEQVELADDSPVEDTTVPEDEKDEDTEDFFADQDDEGFSFDDTGDTSEEDTPQMPDVPVWEKVSEIDGDSLPDIVEDPQEDELVDEESVKRRGSHRASGPAKTNKHTIVSLIVTGVSALVVLVALVVGLIVFLGGQSKVEVASAPAAMSETKDVCQPFKGLDCRIEQEISEQTEPGRLVSQSLKPGAKVDKGTKIVLTYSLGPSEARVPSVIGMSPKEAKKTLASLGLRIDDQKEVPTTSVAKGMIAAQDPKPGTVLSNGRGISISVAGSALTVPDWMNKTREFVEAEAKAARLEPVFVEAPAETADTPVGVVIGMSPKPGTKIEGSNVVKITLSKSAAPQNIEIPEIVGKSREEAEKIMLSAGFKKVSFIEVALADSNIAPNTVAKVIPDAKGQVPADYNIVVLVTPTPPQQS